MGNLGRREGGVRAENLGRTSRTTKDLSGLPNPLLPD